MVDNAEDPGLIAAGPWNSYEGIHRHVYKIRMNRFTFSLDAGNDREPIIEDDADG